jgi:hypothetical protein
MDPDIVFQSFNHSDVVDIDFYQRIIGAYKNVSRMLCLLTIGAVWLFLRLKSSSALLAVFKNLSNETGFTK